MTSRRKSDTEPNYALRRTVAATLVAIAGSLAAHELFSDDDPATQPSTPQAVRTCDGIGEVLTLQSGGLYDKAIEIYPENPPAGVTAIIEANPQMGITNPDLIQPGDYNIPICTLASE